MQKQQSAHYKRHSNQSKTLQTHTPIPVQKSVHSLIDVQHTNHYRRPDYHLIDHLCNSAVKRGGILQEIEFFFFPNTKQDYEVGN